MALTRIIFWLGYTCFLFSGLAGLTALFSLFVSEYNYFVFFITYAFIIICIGASLFLVSYATKDVESNSEAVLFLILFWLLMPALLSPPFIFNGYSPSLASAYFEAMSALSTTGASALIPETLPQSLLIWRSLLQWFGGVITATFGIVILAALNLTGTGVHKTSLFTLSRGNLLLKLREIGRLVFVIYGALAIMCFIFLIGCGTAIFDALCLSLTAISTGGLAPRSEALANYINPASAFILAVFCLFGAANIAVIWDIIRLRRLSNIKKFIFDYEHRGLFFITGFLLLVGLFYAGMQNTYTVFLDAVFFATTAGFDYQIIGIEMIPVGLLIAFALVGGSALSTAGGVKLIRLLLLFRHLGTDLGRLTHPSRIIPVKFNKRIIPDRDFLSIWMYFFGYTLVFGMGIIGLGALDMEYTSATISAAASLSNMGPLLDASFINQTYADFNDNQKMVLSGLMLAGRVEVLAIFALFSPGFWRQ